ncbi:hydrogenase maturation nickel metallochaperone HypA [Haloarchaeobius sp. HME9146]|uniref:hydrogenase maturation nickel metallochaperone HypA n=1 Tax=Haloarchaeobius sp. HME9146 TaxID=2978732 RepID=UPI0021C1EA64|nr:hydrogenase maturation nickel metallochaperone HypA [Haloarchaeobius sp. HME9146]MCT9096829.1 hydrogenase maturation nickel metallochaperone HypA [Haloarchaeobius sp. HME9146]
MSVIDSLKNAFRTDSPEQTPEFRCQFCENEYETAYSICPKCGSERVEPIGQDD